MVKLQFVNCVAWALDLIAGGFSGLELFDDRLDIGADAAIAAAQTLELALEPRNGS